MTVFYDMFRPVRAVNPDTTAAARGWDQDQGVRVVGIKGSELLKTIIDQSPCPALERHRSCDLHRVAGDQRVGATRIVLAP